jgi:hypothetical protein
MACRGTHGAGGIGERRVGVVAVSARAVLHIFVVAVVAVVRVDEEPALGGVRRLGVVGPAAGHDGGWPADESVGE